MCQVTIIFSLLITVFQLNYVQSFFFFFFLKFLPLMNSPQAKMPSGPSSHLNPMPTLSAMESSL